MMTTHIAVENLKARLKSKVDMYKCLSIDLRFLLHPVDKRLVKFMRSILNGTKKALRNNNTLNI